MALIRLGLRLFYSNQEKEAAINMFYKRFAPRKHLTRMLHSKQVVLTQNIFDCPLDIHMYKKRSRYFEHFANRVFSYVRCFGLQPMEVDTTTLLQNCPFQLIDTTLGNLHSDNDVFPRKNEDISFFFAFYCIFFEISCVLFFTA
ncbi:uncharacterized protein LOC108744784 [Agrilus planipennis]|uniref:Uncharacterized protein LOC108744784 n=1 Tax=Agrilus planipennis TaxID=224129 RepID=A0A1W4XTU1_AGRPL|nr:uncharacterized protein LOC108744784 [Agrilus planipennis]